jgi:putative ABC transport system permease protein
VGGSLVTPGWGLGIALAALALIGVAAALLGRLPVSRAIAVAVVRAGVQLAAISLVIVTVVRHPALVAAFVGLMFVVASVTAGARWRCRTGRPLAALAVGLGAAPAIAVVLASGAVPLVGIAVVPVSGILIGGAMTATSVAGRRALDELRTRHGEYEAALALGLTERDAALELCRPSATQALLPPLDQTRTVGLVTLPGAFVGVLLGSGDPVVAGAAQLLVLVGLLAVETIAVLVTIELVARHWVRDPRPP